MMRQLIAELFPHVQGQPHSMTLASFLPKLILRRRIDTIRTPFAPPPPPKISCYFHPWKRSSEFHSSIQHLCNACSVLGTMIWDESVRIRAFKSFKPLVFFGGRCNNQLVRKSFRKKWCLSWVLKNQYVAVNRQGRALQVEDPNSCSSSSDDSVQPDVQLSSPRSRGLKFFLGSHNIISAGSNQRTDSRHSAAAFVAKTTNCWSGLSSLREGGGVEHACVYLCLCICGSKRVGSVSIWVAGWMFICRCCYRKQKWIFRKQNDSLGSHRQLKDYSEKGEVEITSTKTEWNRERSYIRRGRMPVSCWRATNVTK